MLGLHLAFILFVAFGGLLAWWRPVLAALHLPAAAWGAWVELSGAPCPLTTLEVALLRRAGEAGYSGSFLEHYLLAVIYPAGLTRGMQVGLGIAVLAINLAVYALLWRRGGRHGRG